MLLSPRVSLEPSILPAHHAPAQSARGARYAPLLLLVLACIVAVLMRLPGLWVPLERDEGAYGLVAAQWLEGDLPYRDVFDHKPPLIYVLYMPPLLVGVPGPVAIRLWALILFVLQLPLVYAIGRHAWNRSGGGLAALLYAVAGSSFTLQGLMLNTEQALMLPALGALWVLVRADQRLRWPILYGLLLSLVMLIKPTAVPLLVLLIGIAGPASLHEHLRRVTITSCGMLLPLLPIIWYWWSRGALDDLYVALVEYNRLYTADSITRWSPADLVDMLAPLAPLLLCAVGGVALSLAPASRPRLMIVLWTLAFFSAALLSLRPYMHYYFPVVAGLELLAAPAITALARQAKHLVGKRDRLLAAGGPALLFALVAVPFVVDNLRLSGLNPTQQAEALYGTDGRYYFGPAQAVANLISEVTSPDTPIFVLASEPQIYLLSGRRTTTRFIYDYPFGLLPHTREAATQALKRQPPAIIITYHGFPVESLGTWTRAENYRRSRTIGGFDLWVPPHIPLP